MKKHLHFHHGEDCWQNALCAKILSILAAVTLLAGDFAQAGGVVTDCTESNLRAALAGGGTVTFACDGTITLASTITNTLDTILDGTGCQVTISGGNACRVFLVNSNINFTLINLTIANGKSSDGAGIFNDGGTVNLTSTLVVANATEPDWSPNGCSGGGLFNRSGTVNATNCVFSSNSTRQHGGNGSVPPALGGAIRNESGVVNLQLCRFTDNVASGGLTVLGHSSDAAGGALHNSGILNATRCSLLGNSAIGGPGWNAFGYGPGVPGGSGGTGFGGAICNLGTLIIEDCVLANNTAFGGNGGGGTAGHDGGGYDSSTGGSGGSGGSALGGALYSGGTAGAINVTFAGNGATAGSGGNGGSGGSSDYRSAGNGGNGGAGGNGGSGFGAIDGSINLVNCTVALNSAASGSGGYGGSGGNGGNFGGKNGLPGANGINGQAAGGITGGWLVNTLIASNTPAGNDSFPDPKLGPLADNGGPTLTMALLPGSSAINAGDPAAAPPTDQRGVPRPQGPGVDIGAFEYQYVPVFTGAKFQNPTNFWLQMSGLLPGQAFTLQSSINLLGWLDVTNFVAGESLLYEFVDGNLGTSVNRFYRLKLSNP